MKTNRLIMIRIEREAKRLRFVEITQFKHYKALTISNFKVLESSHSFDFHEMFISQDF